MVWFPSCRIVPFAEFSVWLNLLTNYWTLSFLKYCYIKLICEKLCVSPLHSHSQFLTSLLTPHVSFTHPEILQDTSWVFYNSVQFWHYLHRISIRSPKLKTQSCETAPTSGTNQKSQAVTCTSDWLAKNQGSHNPLLGLSNLLEWLTEPRETFMFTSLF